MKKIIFIIPALKHGGTNRCLLNLLSCINNDEYEISIFAMSHIGPYKEPLSKYNILSRDLLLTLFFDSYEKINLKHDTILEIIEKILRKPIPRILRIIFGKKGLEWVYKNSAKKIERMKYDTVIAMQEGYPTHLASYIKTSKIAWIHCDYDEYYKIVKSDEEKIYSKYNNIICVSAYTKSTFIKRFPSLEHKCHGIHNMIDYVSIIQMCNENIPIDNRFNTKEFSIISIGRLNIIKQFHIIPQIVYELKNKGHKFKWYIIGEGQERNHILNLIDRYNVEDWVILLGEKNNPYPYIGNSDLMVVTSLSEACPYVINEAKILHIPVVTTDFGSASEFIENNKNGIIVDKNNIKLAIEEMIMNKDKYKILKKNLNKFIFLNDKIIEEIERLL